MTVISQTEFLVRYYDDILATGSPSLRSKIANVMFSVTQAVTRGEGLWRPDTPRSQRIWESMGLQGQVSLDRLWDLPK